MTRHLRIRRYLLRNNLPGPLNLCSAFPAIPTNTSGTEHIDRRQTPLLRAAATIRPPFAFPRERAPCAGGICAGNMIPGTVRQRPSTRDRR